MPAAMPPAAAAEQPRSSLRRRLLSRVGAAFAVLVLAMSALLWQIARRGADQTYDLLLSGSALAMLERVSDSADGPTVDVPYSALDILALARDERIAYRVFTADGTTLDGRNEPASTGGLDAGARAPFLRRVVSRRADALHAAGARTRH